jgi:hypothetical protein
MINRKNFVAALLPSGILLVATCFSVSQPRAAGQEVMKTQPTNKPHNFARWEKSIAAFEAADRANPPPKGAVLFVGASTITLWKSLARDFPDHKVINRGFGGSEIVDTTHFAERIVFPYEPQMIILRCGSNDIHNGKRPEDVLDDFKAFVSKVREKLPRTEIVFMSLNAIPSRWAQKERDEAANKLLRAVIEQMPRVRILDISEHGGHARWQVPHRAVWSGQAPF